MSAVCACPVKAGADENRGAPFRTATAPLGVPVVNLDRALQLAAELEDEELVRKTRVGKCSTCSAAC